MITSEPSMPIAKRAEIASDEAWAERHLPPATETAESAPGAGTIDVEFARRVTASALAAGIENFRQSPEAETEGEF